MFLPSNITLKLGDSGDFVAELQRRLAARDFLTQDMVSSFYDGATANAVRQFQTAHGIRADGVAGPETLRRLNGFSDSATSSSGGTSDSSEQESGRNLINQRVMQLQMEEAQLHEMEKIQFEIEQQAILQQQVQQQAQQQQTQQQPLHMEQLQQMTETKKQLPGVEPGRDQHTQQRMSDANMHAQMQQQAFIDRPISQTFQSLEQKPEQKPEQDVGTHNRGPNLGQSPERAASAERAPEQQQQQQAGISRPRDDATQRGAATEQNRAAQQGTERTATGQAESAERAPLRITPASTQGTTPDYGRIRQQMESRLPPHVIEEVKQVGVVMLNNGVQGGRTAPEIGAPAQTPGMDIRQPAVGGGRGA